MPYLQLAVISIALTCNIPVLAKIYDRCELARELRDVHEIPDKQLPTWMCIAYHESNFNTSAHNPGSGDHGLLQISQLYWCSPPGSGQACGLPCSALTDENIEDDVICARRIFREHKRLSGDGFNAWVVYNQRCKNPEYVNSFIAGCFDGTKIIIKPTKSVLLVENVNRKLQEFISPLTYYKVEHAIISTYPSIFITNSQQFSPNPKKSGFYPRGENLVFNSGKVGYNLVLTARGFSLKTHQK